jgi:hypothetical protein
MASFGAIVPVRWITTIGVKADPVGWAVAIARQAAKVARTELDGEPDVEMLDLPSAYGGRCESVQWKDT